MNIAFKFYFGFSKYFLFVKKDFYTIIKFK